MPPPLPPLFHPRIHSQQTHGQPRNPAFACRNVYRHPCAAGTVAWSAQGVRLECVPSSPPPTAATATLRRALLPDGQAGNVLLPVSSADEFLAALVIAAGARRPTPQGLPPLLTAGRRWAPVQLS